MLGGAMEIVHDETDLRRYFQTAVSVSNDAPKRCWTASWTTRWKGRRRHLRRRRARAIGGIMEHIEQAGVHSGDSHVPLPAYTLEPEIQDVMRRQVENWRSSCRYAAWMNVQFAVKRQRSLPD
ncbi:hypothetical protein M8494_24150 [Serratia ureilytica]